MAISFHVLTFLDIISPPWGFGAKKSPGGLRNKLCECTPHVFVDDCFQLLGERDVKTLTVIGAIRLHVAVGGVKFL